MVKNLAAMIEEIQASGATSLRQIAAELNKRKARTARGGRWHPRTVSLLLKRLGKSP